VFKRVSAIAFPFFGQEYDISSKSKSAKGMERADVRLFRLRAAVFSGFRTLDYGSRTVEQRMD